MERNVNGKPQQQLPQSQRQQRQQQQQHKQTRSVKPYLAIGHMI